MKPEQQPGTGPIFFASPEEFRDWLEAHHEQAQELWVGYHKKGSGRPTLTWPESVDEALCFGWIDGIRKSIDDSRYMIRFTPRRPGSNWSAVNLGRVEALTAEGRMRPAGLRVYEARDPAKSAVYGYEQQGPAFDPACQSRFEANPAAWEFFQTQPPSYRKVAINYVMSAKRDETRQNRLNALIEDSANGRRMAMLSRPAKAARPNQEG